MKEYPNNMPHVSFSCCLQQGGVEEHKLKHVSKWGKGNKCSQALKPEAGRRGGILFGEHMWGMGVNCTCCHKARSRRKGACKAMVETRAKAGSFDNR